MATINSVIMMVGMPIVGISQGAQPIIGFNYGAKKYDRAHKALKICATAATIGLSILMVISSISTRTNCKYV